MLLAITGEEGLDAAVAIELIHTYSLIHDDLPCMDDDDLRRGKPSLHKAFDEATAVLTGDFLLTYAFEILAASSLPAPTSTALIGYLAKKIGGKGMVGGQSLDLSYKKTALSWEVYQELILRKTADLFSAALTAGAIIQELPLNERELLMEFGQAFGLLYQLLDDCDDGEWSTFAGQAMQTIPQLLQQSEQILRSLKGNYPYLENLLQQAIDTKISLH